MTKAMEITSDEFYRFAEIYCKKAITEELSLVARDKATGNIIGFLISENLASLPPNGIKTINEKFLPIIKLLNGLDENYKQSFEMNGKNILRLFMTGVREHYEGLNIATMLIENSLKLARLNNYSYVISETTGSVTQHILRDKLGFEEKFAIDYKSFYYNGKHVFNNIENSSYCVLFEKRLC
jgi:ribosomal protein S18 acetylase RimI-like enzyme